MKSQYEGSEMYSDSDLEEEKTHIKKITPTKPLNMSDTLDSTHKRLCISNLLLIILGLVVLKDRIHQYYFY